MLRQTSLAGRTREEAVAVRLARKSRCDGRAAVSGLVSGIRAISTVLARIARHAPGVFTIAVSSEEAAMPTVTLLRAAAIGREVEKVALISPLGPLEICGHAPILR